MKNTMLKSISLLGISVMMALSVAAQEPKVKTTDKESKYKSEDLKIKDKTDKDKYKTDDAKIKDKEDETKYKSADMKIKNKKDETKIKGKVKPMQRSMRERTVIKTGETHVKTQEHIESLDVTPATEPVVAEQEPVQVPDISATVKKSTVRKHTVRKHVAPKTAVVSKTTTPVKYITRTKIVRDTVYVPSPPETVVQKEYVHDTVSLSRVDTVIKVQTQNTYTGYSVPRGNFKKVKLKRDKETGDVYMKRKTKDGNDKEKVK